MGAWGVKLYQNDDAADTRDTFKELVRLPVEPGELVARVARKRGLGTDPFSEEEVDGWLVLADQLHQYGMEHAPTFEKARRIITEGIDRKVNEDLEMSPKDLEKRAKVLEGLLEVWSKPHPKPRKRTMMKGPEKFLFAPGDIWIMPAMEGAPLPFFWHRYDPATIHEHYRPDGWAGFAVFDRYHYEDFHARYLIAILALGAEKPEPAQILSTPIRQMTEREYGLDEDDELTMTDTMGDMIFTTFVRTPTKTLRLWEAERLCAVKDPDAEALRAAITSKAKDQHTQPDGTASLEHLMSMSSFHEREYDTGEPPFLYQPHPDMPLSRFTGGLA